MNERFLSIIRMKGMTASQFADLLGIQRSAISHFTSGRNKPSLEMVTKVITAFPDINTEWLLFGTGEPLKNNDAPASTVSEPTIMVQGDKDPTMLFQEEELAHSAPKEPVRTANVSSPIAVPAEDSTVKNVKRKKEEKLPTSEPDGPEQIIFFYEEGRYKIYRPM